MRITDAAQGRAGVSTLIIVAGVFGLTGCVGLCFGGASSAGACAAPSVSVSPATASPGDTVMITGEGFMECHDTQSGCEPPPTPQPQPPQPVYWRIGGEEAELTTATPDADGRVRLEVKIPAETAAGVAEIEIGLSEEVTLTVG